MSYARRPWEDSPAIRKVRALLSHVWLCTNVPELIYLSGPGQSFFDIPEKFDHHTLAVKDRMPSLNRAAIKKENHIGRCMAQDITRDGRRIGVILRVQKNLDRQKPCYRVPAWDRSAE